jgi:hypothetical protein
MPSNKPEQVISLSNIAVAKPNTFAKSTEAPFQEKAPLNTTAMWDRSVVELKLLALSFADEAGRQVYLPPNDPSSTIRDIPLSNLGCFLVRTNIGDFHI